MSGRALLATTALTSGILLAASGSVSAKAIYVPPPISRPTTAGLADPAGSDTAGTLFSGTTNNPVDLSPYVGAELDLTALPPSQQPDTIFAGGVAGTPTPAPEPSTMAILGAALLGLGLLRTRRTHTTLHLVKIDDDDAGQCGETDAATPPIRRSR